MELSDAISLLDHKNFKPSVPQVWADLGCGSGLFTNALASLLQSESLIYAVDKNISSFRLPSTINSVSIKSLQGDFIESRFNLPQLDGVLMANSLHYVKDKIPFLERMINRMTANASFLVVEYDTDKAVQTWVPYPVSFLSLKKLFSSIGFTSVIKMHEHFSVYNNGSMYSALVTR